MLIKKLKHHQHFLPLLILISIAIAICFSNYQPGTYLSGWDTLHPEFNLSLYTQRVIFGAWQEHQGLGAPAAQAHAAELPRLPLVWLLSAILPQSMVRYAFFFLMYVIGGISTYIYLRQSWFQDKKGLSYGWAAMIGSLFYLLNLGTLQHFYVPLEMFAVHFATLGFVLWSINKFLKEPKISNALVFFLVQIISAPSAHTATLFYVYMMVIGLFTTSLALIQYRRKLQFTFSLLSIMAALVFTAHAYWLLPNLYYILFHSDYVSLAKISRNFSPEAFWQNQAYGQFWNVVIVKNFLFNWKDYDFQLHTFVDLLDEWRLHLEVKFGLVIFYFLAFLSIVGVFLGIIKKKSSQSMGIVVLLSTAFFFLINLNFPFSQIYYFLLKSDLLQEALRFPFTKFSILFIFSVSIFLSETVLFILNYMSSRYKQLSFVLSTGIIMILTLLILYANLPALQGNLISSKMKVAYPSVYFELFDWLKNQPTEQRILKLPITTYWGWVYQSWPLDANKQGYQGAGFTWFGIPQPTLDREFDRWVPTNEYLYHELSSSIQDNDKERFIATLNKYDVQYILLDQSTLHTEKSNPLETSIASAKWLKTLPLSLEWEKDFLSVYKLQETSNNSFLEIPETFSITDSNSAFLRNDPIYNQEGNYINDEGKWYPFVNLNSEKNFDVSYTETGIRFTSHLEHPLTDSQVQLSSQPASNVVSLPASLAYNGDTVQLSFFDPVTLNTNDTVLKQPILPSTYSFQTGITTNDLVTNIGLNQIELKQGTNNSFMITFDLTKPIPFQAFNKNNVTVINEIPTIDENQVFNTSVSVPFQLLTFDKKINLSESISTIYADIQTQPIKLSFPDNSSNCSTERVGTIETKITKNMAVYLANNAAVNCSSADLPLLNQQNYLLHISGNNLAGRSLKIFVIDDNTGESIFEELLPEGIFDESFIISTPPEDNFSYRLHWEARSFGQVSVNQIDSIELYPLPLEIISNLSLTPVGKSYTIVNNLSATNSWKLGTYHYGTTINSSQVNGVIVLSQSYDDGWIAFNPQNPLQLFEHKLFNGWANAWYLPPGQYQLMILYWPQLLIFGGYGILLITLLYLLFIIRLNRSSQTITSITPFKDIKKVFLGK